MTLQLCNSPKNKFGIKSVKNVNGHNPQCINYRFVARWILSHPALSAAAHSGISHSQY